MRELAERGLTEAGAREAAAWSDDAAGVCFAARELWTGTDSANAAMLAVNRRLGDVPAHVRTLHVRSL